MPIGNISTSTVTGRYLDVTGQPVAGSVTFTPTASLIIDSGAAQTLIGASVTVALDGQGEFTVLLPVTDDPESNPTGFTYAVRENVPNGRHFHIALPTGVSVDLSAVAPIPDSGAGTVIWAGMPAGGTVGQFMVKTGSANYDAGWTTMADQYLQGTGSPEGVVTAPVGAVYTDTLASAGVARWLKMSGVGNTGWQDHRTPTDGTVTDAKVAVGAAIAPTKIAGTAVVTADSRLSDTRTPSALSVTDSMVSASAAIAQSKIASLTTDLGLKAADAAVVHNSGSENVGGVKTFTGGNVFVSDAAGNPYFVANASDTGAERTAGVLFMRRFGTRWIMAKNQGPESGGNSGSDFVVVRYDDAGSYLGTALDIKRATGEQIVGEPTAGKAHVTYSRAGGSAGVYTGTGFPEGVVTAPVGSIYTDTAATNGAIRWIKATGTGNTGWKVEYGDTGWRNLVGSGYAGPTLAAMFPAVAALMVRRVGSVVTFRFRGNPTSGSLVGTTAVAVMATGLPVGFWSTEYAALGSGKGAQAVSLVSTNTLDELSLVADSAPWAAQAIGLVVLYPTTDAWPATLPGTAA